MKRQITFLSLLALLGAFVFSLVGCGDNPNPCKNLKPVSADFKFQESIYGFDSLFTTPDTVFAGSRVTFTAKEINANYNWKVGDDTNAFTKSSFFLDFNQAYGKVPSTLTVSK